MEFFFTSVGILLQCNIPTLLSNNNRKNRSSPFKLWCVLYICMITFTQHLVVLSYSAGINRMLKRNILPSSLNIPNSVSMPRRQYQIFAYIAEYISGVESNRVRTAIPNVETDFLGMINFCLRTTDNALSGPSKTKILNELTNDVFKAIIIGYPPLINETITKIPMFRELIIKTECNLNAVEIEKEIGIKFASNAENCDYDLKFAKLYLNRLEMLLSNGSTHDSILGGIYDKGYKGLLTLLRDAGCKFNTGTDRQSVPTPIDRNICLSLIDLNYDQIRQLNQSEKPSIDMESTKTRELNKMANVVARCTLYGTTKEKLFIANHLDNYATQFMKRWDPANEGMRSQEVIFIQALALFLRKGFSVTQAAIAGEPVGNLNSNQKNLLQKLTLPSIVIPSYSLPLPSLPSNPDINTTLTRSGGFGESIITGGIGGVSLYDDKPDSLKLYDAYLSAFDKLMRYCITEITAGTQSNMLSQNDDILYNVIEWEQGLRRTLTADLWKLNPHELAGTWELVNIAGGGSLQSIVTTSTNMYFGMTEGLAIEFSKDGRVVVKLPSSVGDRWYFKPGPAHLDTCEFFISSTSKPDLLLKYVGFIDRGQRIESRFSKKPIRMTGRVVSMIKGQTVGSSRFIMVLRRK